MQSSSLRQARMFLQEARAHLGLEALCVVRGMSLCWLNLYVERAERTIVHVSQGEHTAISADGVDSTESILPAKRTRLPHPVWEQELSEDVPSQCLESRPSPREAECNHQSSHGSLQTLAQLTSVWINNKLLYHSVNNRRGTCQPKFVFPHAIKWRYLGYCPPCLLTIKDCSRKSAGHLDVCASTTNPRSL